MRHFGVKTSVAIRLTLAAAVLITATSCQQQTPVGSGDDRGGQVTAAAPMEVIEAPPVATKPVDAPAHYIGAVACAECHAAQQKSYHDTAHAQAFSDVNPDGEPADGTFVHADSGRTYSVYRAEGKLRHRESVKDGQGQDVAAADFAARYLIGSGRHTRSYLMELDGFLVESPITWYASRQSWGMSPGFDRPQHKGFERAADGSCLYCHVGQMSSPDHEYQRFTFEEQAIGCERCHGPGSRHQNEERELARLAAWQQSAAPPERTKSIVHPGHLSRELSEAICSQCHLMGDALVTVRGRGIADYRPGSPLADYVINYFLATPGKQMTVVGHVGQLHQSRCYRGSEQLTCTTCHDPHSELPAAERQSHYVQVCQSCHAADSCGLNRETRLARNAANDCVACHMPRVDTDIPHIAFTHHRIGIHDRPAGSGAPTEESPAVAALGELIPVDDLSQVAEAERQRNLGLAYFGFSQSQGNPQLAHAYGERARGLLMQGYKPGLNDGEVSAALARLAYADRDGVAALTFAREALSYPALSAKSRINALFYVGQLGVQQGQLPAAEKALIELTRSRRLSEDWRWLGVCRQQAGDLRGALAGMQKAAEIAPFRPEIHDDLAQLHQWMGSAAAAQRERTIFDRLSSPPSAGR